jgi:hypothetical protein
MKDRLLNVVYPLAVIGCIAVVVVAFWRIAPAMTADSDGLSGTKATRSHTASAVPTIPTTQPTNEVQTSQARALRMLVFVSAAPITPDVATAVQAEVDLMKILCSTCELHATINNERLGVAWYEVPGVIDYQQRVIYKMTGLLGPDAKLTRNNLY